jgi:4-amino-4-deoxy-L-arabinose transferase-like glycosyltransferase
MPQEKPKMSKFLNSQIYLIILLFVLGCMLAVNFQFLRTERLLPDEALYGWYAKEILRSPGKVLSPEVLEFHPPLFSILLAAGNLILPKEYANHLVPLLISLSGVVIMYFLGQRIKDRFLGVFSATILAFNFYYLDFSTYIFVDNSLLVFTILLVLVLARAAFPLSWRDRAVVGFLSSAVILVKWPGVLVIPLVFFFSLVSLPKGALAVREATKNILAPLLVSLLLLSINFYQTGHILPVCNALKGIYLKRPFWYYGFRMHDILMLPYLVPFFLFGLGIVHADRKKGHLLLLIWFWIFMAAISFIGEKDLRYALLILPVAILLSGVGLSFTLEKSFKHRHKGAEILALIIILLTFWILFPKTERLMRMRNGWHVGFKEAGTWIKDNVDSNTLILASSDRAIRYYSDINFQRFGGSILDLPQNYEDFKRTIQNTPGPVIVEVDYWEMRSLRPWIYSVSPETIDKVYVMKGLGFDLVKVVEGPGISAREKRNIIPLIWIFAKGSFGEKEYVGKKSVK